MAVRSGRGARSFGGADEQASEDLRELADVSTMNMQLTAAAAAAGFSSIVIEDFQQHVSDGTLTSMRAEEQQDDLKRSVGEVYVE